ncbi:hypothetical protein J437_LFUL007674 [Ladona fulva]|uniref:Uncharacterized protein n=1 Tax=Ladona fulva TaxID=123851 RepID=A0A8K0KBS2_LADFU|nr:hypothetical protein J437_LFUL007674 [Ladona fulva]
MLVYGRYLADGILLCLRQFIKTREKRYSVEAYTKMCEAYKAHFGIPVCDQDKSWALFSSCRKNSGRGEKRAMKLAIQRIWQEPTDHSSNCYFWMVNPSKCRTGKNDFAITYSVLPSSIAPVPHCHEFCMSTRLERAHPSLEDSKQQVREQERRCRSRGFEETNLYYPYHKDENDLITDLGPAFGIGLDLYQVQLKQWNLLVDIVKVTVHRKRHHNFCFFLLVKMVSFCLNVASLFTKSLPQRLQQHQNLAGCLESFLGNHQAENFVELVETLMKNYDKMGFRTFLKTYIFYANLYKFKENLGACSEEQGEPSHDVIPVSELRYQGHFNENTMGDCIWGLVRESDLQYICKS